MSWQETIGKNLIKNVEVTIGDNTTKVDVIDGKLKIDHYYKDILQKTENKNVDNTTTVEYLPLSTYFTESKTESKTDKKSKKVEKVEPIRICVDTINQTTNSNRDRDLHSTPQEQYEKHRSIDQHKARKFLKMTSPDKWGSRAA